MASSLYIDILIQALLVRWDIQRINQSINNLILYKQYSLKQGSNHLGGVL